MKSFGHIFFFELKYRLGRLPTYLYFLPFFILIIILMVNGFISFGSEKAYLNSSRAIHNLVATFSIFCTMIASAFMGVPVYRDLEHNTKGYFMSYPIGEKGYLLGRYLGSFVVLFLVCLSIPLGQMVGAALGPVLGLEEADRFGPLNFSAYLNAVVIILLPNLFFVGTLFFSLVALTRKIFAAYTGSVLFFIAYLLANALTQDIEQRDLAAILDPFGLNALGNATRYWTPVEQNTSLPPLEGALLWNRLLWIGLGLAMLLFTLYRFNFNDFVSNKIGKSKSEKAEEAAVGRLRLPQVTQSFTTGIYFRQMFRLAWLEFTNVVRDIYFLGILLGGVLFLFLDGWFGSPIYGTPSLPTTFAMLEVKDATYIVFVFIILIFYTGEVVHRDRSVNFNNIADALPVPNWMIYGSKFLALVYVAFMLVNLPLVCGVLNQVARGYFNFEFGMYFTDLYLLEFPEYLQLTMLTFFVHILVNNKFPGHVVSISIWVLLFALRNFAELDYNLFFYSYTSGYTISDMNGFGSFFKSMFTFNGYWLALGALLLTLGNLFWNRGAETDWRTRWAVAKQRLNPVSGALLSLFTLIWLGLGGLIYYNVSVLNTYRTADQGRDAQADFEKRYRKLERVLQPKITDLKLYADLFPEELRATVRSVATMTNKWDRPIDTLYVSVTGGRLQYLKINGQALEPIYRDSIMTDRTGSQAMGEANSKGERGFVWYKLPKTLAPGDTATMETMMVRQPKGFANSGFDRELVANGTFIGGGIPSFGYPGIELSSDKERKKRGLPERKYSQPPQDDKWGLSNLLFNDDADYITYECVVSTAPDQLAISPGYLQREWLDKGRRYFHYKMEGEMDMFFNLVSARYAVAKDVWNGPKGEKVNIEIFHHPTHQYNVERFTKSVKASLDYFGTNFTPYQYKQMRILEFPRYAGFAQSFPNTVPYSESFGWLGNFSNPDDTDYAFYVTSHEVAHQWWGHQVTPSNTRGANQLSETLAEYSALMVLKNAYSNNAMQKFLRYALDRYLSGRANESKFEETLFNNDSRSYVWYQKGSLIMYALADYIGEDKLNQGLKSFLDTAAFRPQAPFATTGEFLPYLEAVTPDSLQYFIEDSWKKIVLYENRVVNATYQKTKDNEYKVKMTVMAKKIYYDGLGKEIGTGKGKKDYIDLGVFAEDGKNAQGMKAKTPLYLQKHWLGEGEQTFEFTVQGKPVKAGIDPYNKLIDRVPEDNLKAVEEQ